MTKNFVRIIFSKKVQNLALEIPILGEFRGKIQILIIQISSARILQCLSEKIVLSNFFSY